MSEPRDGGEDLFDRVLALVNAQHEGGLTAEQLAELESLVLGEPRAAALYLACVEETASLRMWAAAGQASPSADLDGDEGRDDVRAAIRSADAMVLPALREADFDGPADAGADRFAPQAARPSVGPRRGGRRWRLIAAAATAATAAGVAVALLPALRSARPPAPARRPWPIAVVPATQPENQAIVQRPPAVLSATSAAVLGEPTMPGSALAAGDGLNLKAGAIEITFDSGAVVVASAPARVRVVGRNRLALEAGSVAAHVPAGAVGFEVDSPGLAVVDHGTDFGVRTGGEGTVVDVFTGIVDAAAVSPHSDGHAVRVTAGHAVAHAAGDGSAPREAAYAPATFVRSIDTFRTAIPLHGTAADVSFEMADPNWQLVGWPDGMAGGPAGRPRPTYAVALDLRSYVHTTAAAKWISTTPKPTDAIQGTYTFRTAVALPEFAAGTLSVRADWAADDWIADIVVNGAGTAAANGPVVGRATRQQPLTWTLDGAAWHAGDNRVDVLVVNKPGAANAHNYMGLKLSWSATACPPVHRATTAEPAHP